MSCILYSYNKANTDYVVTIRAVESSLRAFSIEVRVTQESLIGLLCKTPFTCKACARDILSFVCAC